MADSIEEISKRKQNGGLSVYYWDEIRHVHNPLFAISNPKSLKKRNKYPNSFGF